MNEPVHMHQLGGCSPTPLASYLKALGILRVVCEQADPKARGAWRHERFALWTTLDRAQLEAFFLEDYVPSPVVTPWNGGSGFFPNDNKGGIDFIEGSTCPRFAPYRETIAKARTILTELELKEKPDAKHMKPKLLASCRARFSDLALDWLDAAYALGDTDPRYPPLLGTGGNEGRLEFANNLMQRLSELFTTTGQPTLEAPGWVCAALWGEAVAGLRSVSIGQFQPAAAGGPNAAAGFEGKANVNPWDFVLMIEGALMLAATAVRRYDADAGGRAAFPFTVGATATGYGSAGAADEGDSRGELWLPLWHEPCGTDQLRALMGEGRADVRGRRARSGLDFAQAVSSLGVDRGIEAFERYGFHVRNGLSYFATTLGRHQVHDSRHVGLLGDLDAWLGRYRGKCSGDSAPASVRRALRRFEQRAMTMVSRENVGDVSSESSKSVADAFLALGDLQRALSASLSFCAKSFIQPLPALRRAWFEEASTDQEEASTDQPEGRLALALASVDDRYGQLDLPLRAQLEPVERRGRFWSFAKISPVVVAQHASLVDQMAAMLQRRLLLASSSGERHYADRGKVFAGLADIDAFVLGHTDDDLLERWLRACILLEPVSEREYAPRELRSPIPYAAYALPKLAFAPGPVRDTDVPITPRILRLMLAGRAPGAMRASARRLRGSGLTPTTNEAHASADRMRRCAAALLFPICLSDAERLAGRYLRPDSNSLAPSPQPDPSPQATEAP